MFPNKKAKLSVGNQANSKEASEGKLNRTISKIIVSNEKINDKTREDVLVESLNKMKDKNMKYRNLAEVKEELQRILDVVYKFEGRPNFVGNKIGTNSEYKNFIIRHLLVGKYNHITIYQFTILYIS